MVGLVETQPVLMQKAVVGMVSVAERLAILGMEADRKTKQQQTIWPKWLLTMVAQRGEHTLTLPQ
jgi:hypothetical protein